MQKLAACFTQSACLLWCMNAWAADSTPKEIEAPVVEVSAFRVPTLITEAAQGVTVVTSQEIEARKPSTTAEVLQMVPGVQVGSMGSPGGLSTIFIRGNDPEHTLVLIDGVRMNDPLLSRGGAYDLSALDPSTIERIEVIRGAGSALYGADAIGGVVNIITKQGAKDGVKVSGALGAGTKNYRNGNARITGGMDQIKVSVGAAKIKDGRESDGGTLNLTTFDGTLAWQAASSAEVKLFARRNDRKSTAFPDISGGVRLATNRTLENRDATENLYGGGAALSPGADWKLNLQATRYTRIEDIVSPGVGFTVPPVTSNTDLSRNAYLASGSVKLPANSDVTVGYERIREDGEIRSVLSTGFGPISDDANRKRTTNSIFAALKTKPVENLVLLLDVRRDNISGLKSETSPSIAIRYDLAKMGPALKARYSEGFRAPSFYALSSPTVGNPDLKAETSKSGELGVEHWLNASSQLGLSVFRTRTKNLIDFDSTVPGPIGFGGIVNRDSVESQGVETYVTVQPVNQLDVAANYTYVTTDVLNSTRNLANRPKQRGSVLIAYRVDDASRLSWNTIFVGSSFDNSDPTGDVKVGAYWRTDVSYSYRWKSLEAAVAVDNLFDKRYEEFVGFTNPGRRFRISVSASF